MRHLSLFTGSGIGDYAAKQAGITTVAQCENDPACQYALRKLWPECHLFGDVKDVSGEAIQRLGLGPIDIASGGFPCVDISTAGRGAGLGTPEAKTRSGLWYEMARVIGEVRPRWVLAENVSALYVRGADRVLADLEALDYQCWPIVVGSWAVGAPHKRDRVWIVARRVDDSNQTRWGTRPAIGSESERPETPGAVPSVRREAVGHTESGGAPTGEQRRRLRGVVGTGEGLAIPRSLALGSRGNEPERGAEGGDAVGRAGEAVGYATCNDQRRLWSGPGEQSRAAGGSGSGESVADAIGPRRKESASQPGDAGEERPAIERSRLRPRFPARPSEPQHAWEAPRLAQFGVGSESAELARRILASLGSGGNGIPPHQAASRANKSLLRMIGNGWQYEIPAMIYEWIMETA